MLTPKFKFSNKDELPKVTKLGFEKRLVPEKTWNLIKKEYHKKLSNKELF